MYVKYNCTNTSFVNTNGFCRIYTSISSGNTKFIFTITSLKLDSKSQKVKRQALQSLSTIKLSETQFNMLVEKSKYLLVEWDQGVRKLCLTLLARSCTPSSQSLIQQILGKFTHDRDPRVRTAALCSLIELHKRGIQLGVYLYQHAVDALKDDYKEVREQAIELLCVLANSYPKHIVTQSKSSLTLVDDAFSKICTMVKDFAMPVRQKV